MNESLPSFAPPPEPRVCPGCASGLVEHKQNFLCGTKCFTAPSLLRPDDHTPACHLIAALRIQADNWRTAHQIMKGARDRHVDKMFKMKPVVDAAVALVGWSEEDDPTQDEYGRLNRELEESVHAYLEGSGE